MLVWDGLVYCMGPGAGVFSIEGLGLDLILNLISIE